MDDLKSSGYSPVVGVEEKEEKGSFTVLLRFLRRFIVLIIAFTILGTIGGYFLARRQDQTVYTQTKSVVVVASIDDATKLTNISLTDRLKLSIAEAIKTAPTISNRASSIYYANCEEQGKTAKGGVYRGSVNVEVEEGMILSISYSAASSEEAADKLDAFIEAVQEKSSELFTSYANEVNLYPLDNAPKTTSSNGFIKLVLLGVLGGLVAGLAIAFIIYILDNTISSKSDLERLTGSTVVAYIDDIAQ